MKVGVLCERLNKPLTGVGRYTHQLLNQFDSQGNASLCLINYINLDCFIHLNTIVVAPILKVLPKSDYFWIIYMQYKLKYYDFDFDLIHSPENAALFIKRDGCKNIITVCDLIACNFPDTVSFVNRLRYKYLFPRSIRAADKIIAISECTKRDIISHFRVDPRCIKVIPLAAGSEFTILTDYIINEFRYQYKLNYPFILYVGQFGVHKNVSTLIYAYYKLKSMGISSHKLVLAGERRGLYNELNNLVLTLDLSEDVLFLGYVPDSKLPALYNAADLFVYPSLYEGFGLPPLEAMACGTPVITSNTSSLPEVVGDAGIMFDPYDSDQLAAHMYEVLNNESLNRCLIQKGIIRAKMFSWEKCARETMDLYLEVFNGD